MSIRPLHKDLFAIAAAELNEDPKRTENDLEYIKNWLKQQKHIRARIEDQWLLAFLRGCKFSLERTKEKLDMFYTVRTILPDFFSNRDPFSKETQDILKQGILLPLTKAASPASPRVLLMRTGYDPAKVSLQNLFRVLLMIMDILVNEDDQLTIAGIVGFQDMKNISMNHMAHMNLPVVKKAMICLQEAYPNRPKAMHFYQIPSYFETIFNTFRPFMKEKLQQRVVLHSGENLDKIHKVIPKSILPTEYGGESGTVQDLIDHWKKKVESYRDWFKEDEKKYGTDEIKRPGKPKTSGDIFGVEGSFRKLNVD